MNRLNVALALKRNPALDLKKVQEYENFREQMARAGINLVPEYRIMPAMGEGQSLRLEQSAHVGQRVLSLGRP